MKSWLRVIVSALLRGAIQTYRLTLSPLLGPSCRFAPSCSAYALEAIEMHGPWAGTRLAAGRILRCHPFHPGGFDPVPVKVVNPRGERSVQGFDRGTHAVSPAGGGG